MTVQPALSAHGVLGPPGPRDAVTAPGTVLGRAGHDGLARSSCRAAMGHDSRDVIADAQHGTLARRAI